ncbi:hypothetical protein EDB92DRAFT_1153751 [Lactarius akahatsu]|uniref:Uncharacterized protein n=1 Tax=Lactarius akahatsu TaxID=416441 RepID=A0AAD4LD06_9AGAM|nr:hypothetical protein EDB92DRAFT_1153751 [Lactarius akahatsu]
MACGFGPASTQDDKESTDRQARLTYVEEHAGEGLYVSYVPAKQVPCQVVVHRGGPRFAVQYNVCKTIPCSPIGISGVGCAKPACTCGRCRSPEKPRDLRGTAALRWARPCQHISVDPPTTHALADPIREDGLLPPASEGGELRGLRRRQSKASTKTACTIRQPGLATNQQDHLGSAGALLYDRSRESAGWGGFSRSARSVGIPFCGRCGRGHVDGTHQTKRRRSECLFRADQIRWLPVGGRTVPTWVRTPITRR